MKEKIRNFLYIKDVAVMKVYAFIILLSVPIMLPIYGQLERGIKVLFFNPSWFNYMGTRAVSGLIILGLWGILGLFYPVVLFIDKYLTRQKEKNDNEKKDM